MTYSKNKVSCTFNDPYYGQFTTTLHYVQGEFELNLHATTTMERPLSERDEYLFKAALADIKISDDRLTLIRIFDPEQEQEQDPQFYFCDKESEFVRAETSNTRSHLRANAG